jgi:hypothetical protein
MDGSHWTLHGLHDGCRNASMACEWCTTMHVGVIKLSTWLGDKGLVMIGFRNKCRSRPSLLSRLELPARNRLSMLLRTRQSKALWDGARRALLAALFVDLTAHTPTVERSASFTSTHGGSTNHQAESAGHIKLVAAVIGHLLSVRGATLSQARSPMTASGNVQFTSLHNNLALPSSKTRGWTVFARHEAAKMVGASDACGQCSASRHQHSDVFGHNPCQLV